MTLQAVDLELIIRRCAAGDAASDMPAAETQPAAEAEPGEPAGSPDAAGTPPALGQYSVEMRVSVPGSDADTRLGLDAPLLLALDFIQLRAAGGDPAAYARVLSGCFYAAADFKRAFSNALSAAEARGFALRVRLLLEASATELLNLRWELLLHPETGEKLFCGEKVFFSRFLVSHDWRPVQLLPRGELFALLAVANPADLSSKYQLAAIDVPGELARAQRGLSGMDVTPLSSAEPGERCTLKRLVAALRAGGPDGAGYDVLFLVCHGAYLRGEPWLLLEDENGKTARVPGAELAARIGELEHCPRLVVLASCESAGDSAGQALTALGPRLAEAGVPAVVAMQGQVSMDSMEALLPCFFSELMRDGQIDRALAVARGTLRERADYWMPVLFMRLKSGRLWYTPGFGGEDAGFGSWEALTMNIKKGLATAVIGGGILDGLLGSSSQIASAWAESYRYPLEYHERDHLPQVAQYIAIQQQDANFPRYKLIEFLRQQAQARYAGLLPEALQGEEADLDAILELAMLGRAKALQAQGRVEPHQFLAALNIPIYITTSPTNLLASALKAHGKHPRVVVCPWNPAVEALTAETPLDAKYRPSVERPLVYHLFGRFDMPESMVLTEDDYFDFLIGVTKNDTLVPTYVRAALVASSLLFIGFQLDAWDFRVFYRSIINQEGGGRRTRKINVGVQVDQENGEISDPERARDYLEKYFNQAAISLYWGSSEDFLQELAVKLKAKNHDPK